MEKEMRRLQQKTTMAQRLFALCHQKLSQPFELSKRPSSAQFKRTQMNSPTLYKAKRKVSII